MLVFSFVLSGCNVDLKSNLSGDFKLETFPTEDTKSPTYKEDVTESIAEYDIKNALTMEKTFPNSKFKTKVPSGWDVISVKDMDVYHSNVRSLYLITISPSSELSPEAKGILSSTSFSEMYDLFDASGQIKKLQPKKNGVLSFFSEFSPSFSLLGTCNYGNDKIYGSTFFAATDGEKTYVAIYVIEKENSLEKDATELKDFSDAMGYVISAR